MQKCNVIAIEPRVKLANAASGCLLGFALCLVNLRGLKHALAVGDGVEGLRVPDVLVSRSYNGSPET